MLIILSKKVAVQEEVEYGRVSLKTFNVMARVQTGGKAQVAHLSAAAGAGERCDWDPSRRTGGGRVRSRVVE